MPFTAVVLSPPGEIVLAVIVEVGSPSVEVGGPAAEHEALDARPGNDTQTAPNSGSFKLSSQLPGCKDPSSQRRMIGVESPMQKDVSPVQDWPGVGKGVDVVEVLVGGV